ncbi:unnamed protein product [Discula destructiva]
MAITSTTSADATTRNGVPAERATELFIVFVVLFVISWILVLLRAYVRYFMIKKVSADDWWMLVSMIVFSGYTANNIIGVIEGGSGRHVTDLNTQQIYIGLKTWYIAEVLYGTLSATVRTSVALFLFRVSVERSHRWIILINLLVVWVISLVFTFVVIFQCSPPSYFYDQALGLEGRCMDISVVPSVTIAHSAIGALCDLIFASLPVAMLWNVRLNKRTKVSVAFLLGMGFVSGVALIVRIPYVKVLAISPDFLFETVDVAIWSVLELSLGIISCCLATLRPLFKRFGVGRNTTKGTTSFGVDYYRKSAPTVERRPSGPTFRLQKLDGFGMPPAPQSNSHLSRSMSSSMELTRRDSSLVSKHDEVHMVEPLEIPRPSVITNIRSSRDPWAEHPTVDSRTQGISVHTSIRTESIYAGGQSTKAGFS